MLLLLPAPSSLYNEVAPERLSSKLKIIHFPDVYSYLFPFFFHATSKLKEGEKVRVNI
jgi:hypothetical protein